MSMEGPYKLNGKEWWVPLAAVEAKTFSGAVEICLQTLNLAQGRAFKGHNAAINLPTAGHQTVPAR